MPKRSSKKADLTEALLTQILAIGLPPCQTEYRFAAHHVGIEGKGIRERLKKAGLKDWRFDLAWPELGIAVECEGGGWVGGRHNTGVGFAGDMQKYHYAAMLGFKILYRCDAAMIRSGQAIAAVEKLVGEAICG